MRLVIDARELRSSTGRYVERLLHYLQEIDTVNTYKVLLYPKDLEGWMPTNKNFQKVACPYKEFTFAEQIGMAKLLYSLRANLVHFGMTQQPILYFKPSVTTIHDLTTIRFKNPSKNPVVFWVKQQVYKIVIQYAAHKSKTVITPTHFVKNDLAQYTHVAQDKVVVTNESADKIADSPIPVATLGGKKFIMYVGRPTPHKNLDRLVDAFCNVNKAYPNLYLVLVGKSDFNLEILQKKVNEKKIPHIIFTGFVTDGQLRWLYEKAEAYVFPSLSEGFGLPGVEAMHYDTPLVSSNATCLPEVYGNAALYFDPYNTSDIAHKILNILSDNSLRRKLIRNERKQREQYSWRRMAEQTLAVYQKALNNK